MRSRVKFNRPAAIKPGKPTVLFDRSIFGSMMEALGRSPSVEEGGKYVGYYLAVGDPRLEELGVRSKTAVAIVDFLPSGPNAKRTAGELLPDGVYQENLFRRLETVEPTIEHVGTWHSHHCNGLETLSGGDVDGYFKTVNKPAYNLDFFVASLVKRIPAAESDRDWIDHFLFLRGASEYFKITKHVRLVDWSSPFADLIKHTEHVRESNANAPTALFAWSDTATGRSVLATDKRFFDATFESVLATRRAGQITLTGHVGSRTIAVTYPRDEGQENVSVRVVERECTVMRIECSLAQRDFAYKAALTPN